MIRPDPVPSIAVCLTLLLSPVAPPVLAAAEPELLAVGEVRDDDGETLLYRERHLAPSAGGLPTRVEYRMPGGELFAEKTLDYSRSSTAPAIDFRDHRRDARIVTRYPDASNPGRLELVYHPPGDEAPEREMFRTDSLIVDAGFDAFIRQHWERLLDGDRITAEFLVATRTDAVRVGLTEVDTDRCQIAMEDIHCLEARPAGALRLFSWFVEPVRLAYHPEPLRLVFYHGRGNIPDASGDERQVRIHYEYEGIQSGQQ